MKKNQWKEWKKHIPQMCHFMGIITFCFGAAFTLGGFMLYEIRICTYSEGYPMMGLIFSSIGIVANVAAGLLRVFYSWDHMFWRISWGFGMNVALHWVSLMLYLVTF